MDERIRVKKISKYTVTCPSCGAVIELTRDEVRCNIDTIPCHECNNNGESIKLTWKYKRKQNPHCVYIIEENEFKREYDDNGNETRVPVVTLIDMVYRKLSKAASFVDYMDNAKHSYRKVSLEDKRYDSEDTLKNYLDKPFKHVYCIYRYDAENRDKDSGKIGSWVPTSTVFRKKKNAKLYIEEHSDWKIRYHKIKML